MNNNKNVDKETEEKLKKISRLLSELYGKEEEYFRKIKEKKSE